MSEVPTDQPAALDEVDGEAWVPAQADDMPTPEEEAAAERAAAQQPAGVGEAYDEMADIGAQVRGEGQIDVGEG